MSENPTPLDAAVECVIVQLSDEDLAAVKNASPDDIAMMHFGLGQWIRNSFGLWAGSPLRDFLVARGIEEEDDMSAAVIRAVQARLRGATDL